jgi:carbonic anhydrase/acetyltransferase-like protein (isoleucine patch superfamily)
MAVRSGGAAHPPNGAAGSPQCKLRVKLMQSIRDYYVAFNAVVRGDVLFSAGVNIWYNCVVRGDLARITLGQRVNIQDGCIVHTDSDAPLDIEEGVVIGHGAILHGQHIGKDSLIGMGAILLSGSDIGEGCIIAAATVITEGRRIPPRSLVMGVPGKVIRPVSDEEVDRTRTTCGHYLEMAQRHARGGYVPPWQR